MVSTSSTTRKDSSTTRKTKPETITLTAEQLEELGREMDEIRKSIVDSLGEEDANYIRNVVIGAVLAVASFYAFYSGLGIPLPAGILDGIL